MSFFAQDELDAIFPNFSCNGAGNQVDDGLKTYGSDGASRIKNPYLRAFRSFFFAQDELAVINSLCLSVPNKKSKVFLILILSALVYWQREIKLKTIFKNKFFFFS